ncbi:site-specific integrase [Streptomyces sp. NBC_00445]|uniref:hypothetical protein n=1 Tax=Streptomyces sp. NBC_00445 TaxID=2975745 RepID=UPI002E1F12E2
MNTESVHFHGKGSKDRRVRSAATCGPGPSTRRPTCRSCGWPSGGSGTLAPNGIKIMLKRRGLAAGLVRLHAHRWRHTFAHERKRAGGDTGDLMLPLGWTSQEIPRRYGASAAAERAQETHQRIGVGDHA